MEATTGYRLEVHLMGGETIVSDLPGEGVETVASFNPGVVVPPDEAESLAIARMIYTVLLYRMSEGTGFYQLTDLEGRQWVLRAEAILAFNIQAPKGRTLGFEPLAEIPPG